MSSVALVNAVLLALWAVVPLLVIGYIRQSIAARRIQPELSLRKLESIELDRAVLLYEKVCNRLKDFDQQLEHAKANASWWARHRRRAQIRRQYGDELADLEAYAHHLRSTIIRLRRRPIRRFKAWLHTISSHFAFSRSLVAYCVLLAVLTASLYLSELYLSEQLAWATEIKTRFDALLIWKPLDERLLYANGIAAGCVAVAAPVFYIARLARLHSTHRPQIRVLKEFAGTDPDRLIRQSQDDRADQETLHEAALAEASDDDTWFAVLGLSPTATIEEVKEAYKALIKQNHPDRVHGMSPAFRELAEAETRKLNSAYEEALNLLRPLEFEQRASSG